MNNVTRKTLASVTLTAGLVSADAKPAIEQQHIGCLSHSVAPAVANSATASGASSVAYQQFPAFGPMETAWYVTFDHAVAKGLYITSARFKPAPDREWLEVLGRAGVSQIFVPYQSGWPRFYDLALAHNFDLEEVTEKDVGRCGAIVGPDNKVALEVIDKGPLWKNDQLVVRGQMMILWATIDAANYNYILRYEFHDDGSIKFRIAGTAENLPSARGEAHTHNALWRVDVNLNGSNGDSVNVLRHLEDVGEESWRNVVEPFNGGKEGALDFVAREFTQIQIVDATLANAAGLRSAYDLRPLFRGVVRHAEPFMRNDYWVTKFREGETSFEELPVYDNDESIRNTDVVLWHVTPILHIPRSEDGVQVGKHWKGVALAMWAGFDLRPRDLFDGTPFYR